MPMPSSLVSLAPGALAAALLASGCAWLQGSAPAGDSAEARDVATQRALEYLPDQESLHWVDPETDQAAQVTVLQTLPGEDDRPCRLLLVGGGERPDSPVERFCRDPESAAWRFDGRLSAVEAQDVLAATRSEADL